MLVSLFGIFGRDGESREPREKKKNIPSRINTTHISYSGVDPE